MIDIPGYRVVRPLGRGGMATVYLALQESVDREVALKVMSPTLLADPTYGERFLREARIAARLHHPHVVGIHDVGRHGDYFYIAMEYIAGGPVLHDDGKARDVPFTLRVVREIAKALGYANSKSFVHRDVKPDNILLREDGSSALTDFGIARANDSATRMTRTGAVVGTPHYMSPEQARGRGLDGRSDLYSLGIVMYELLAGRVPYHAEDSLAVGIMHITQPVPLLPVEYKALQPTLDLLLAKEPEQRFQDGNAVATAIEQIERRLERGELRELLQGRTASAPTMALPSITPLDPGARAEPRFGTIDLVDSSPQRFSRISERRDNKAKRNNLGPWLFTGAMVALVAVAAFTLWRNQDKLRALLPRTELNDVLVRAENALAKGKLSGNAGDSARELFESARVIDPDNDIARAGLRRVGEALVAEAVAATQRRDYAVAHARLADARALLAGGTAVDKAAAELKLAEAQNTEVASLFDQAEAALAAGKLLDAGGAVDLYERVLASDSGNAPAQAGLRKTGAALAAQTRDLLNQGKVDEATTRIEAIARALPNDPSLPNLRAELTAARGNATAALDAQLRRGQELLRSGRVDGPGEETALAQFKAVLARDPNNSGARAGLAQVAQALIVQANAALEESNSSVAERLIRQAEQLAPGSADLAAVRSRLRDLREQVEIAASRPVLTPEQQQKLTANLAAAGQAAQAGNLIMPPGTSAYDKYRAVLALDGSNAQAQAGLQALPQIARDQFNQALGEQKLARARDMIDTLEQLSPSDAALTTLRARLAEALLDEAERRVAENRPGEARRALDAARGLSPANPRLGGVEQKLRELSPAAGGNGL
ncbi:serine/threonine protein kinase [Tahibacter aquaticus]|uniref:Serine/threonine protein kinase n=1 Tax=Tahibacter aquaticus TaxID=520092 RepID=A0A4R6YW79_9GAMM|nr:serine/threonine-protein kinase [Tahibacter aquaticus]TDR43074.1 serine/threonine protein kinase [Tahibacter aquaticus]